MSTSHFPTTVRKLAHQTGAKTNIPVFDMEEAASSEARILFTLADIDEL